MDNYVCFVDLFVHASEEAYSAVEEFLTKIMKKDTK